VDGKPLLRAYSVASAHYEEHMEFLSIKVPDGPLTSRLKNIQVGDTLLVGRKATGTLLLSHMLPGRNLYFLSTGTGLAPFMSLIRDPDVYDNYEKLVLVHGCRQVDELAYHDFITEELPKNDFLGEQVAEKLIYYPTVTREDFVNRGRVTELIETGKLFADIGLPEFDPELDRVMICGSEDMLGELVEKLKARGWHEGHNHKPGQYVIEKAFAEK
jgi:ferredoxin--NADP+ reductase